MRLKEALDQAAVWHRDQIRKYPDVEVPYFSHCAGVALVLTRHGLDEDVVVAGVLHDILEDCDVTVEQLAAQFGDRVAGLVNDVSEQDKSLPWEERKQQYVERFRTKSWDAQAISLADKIDNFRSIRMCAQRYGDPWGMFKRGRDKQLWRFGQLEGALADLAPHALIDEYRAELAVLREL